MVYWRSSQPGITRLGSTPQQEMVRQQRAFTAVGALIVTCAHIERSIAKAIGDIEKAEACLNNYWPPTYTNVHELRVPELKTRLRELFRAYGTPQEISDLEANLSLHAQAHKTRKMLAHHQMFYPDPNDPDIIETYQLDRTRGVADIRKHSIEELHALYETITEVPGDIGMLTLDVFNSIQKEPKAP